MDLSLTFIFPVQSMIRAVSQFVRQVQATLSRCRKSWFHGTLTPNPHRSMCNTPIPLRPNGFCFLQVDHNHLRAMKRLVLMRSKYEDLSFNSENGHDRNLLQLLRNVTQFVPKQTVKEWKLCQRASTCANVPNMTILRIK